MTVEKSLAARGFCVRDVGRQMKSTAGSQGQDLVREASSMGDTKAGPAPAAGRHALIRVADLTKKFDGVTAVDGIHFDVFQGEFFGFLGPNGAGKTTTINMLTGLARPDTGTIRIAGLECTANPKAAQRLIGVVPDESSLYPELSGFANLCFCASLYGMRRAERRKRAGELLETFGLEEAADRAFAGYSRGMKRKLTIAAGIIHRPRILFLDEPTTGIDVASARGIRQLIAGLHRSGTTIFLTTHYIEEAERLCERIAFIVKGRIVQTDSITNLLQPVKERKAMLISVVNAVDDLAESLSSAFPQFIIRPASEGRIRVESANPIGIGPLVRFIESRGAEVTEARRLQPSLEDVFIQITGIEADIMKKEKEKSGGGR
jgi:ABC-2 type transport system ATP-binding protein